MFRAVGQQSLSSPTLKPHEVGFKVRRQLDSIIILESSIQNLQHRIERRVQLQVLQGEVFQERPSCPGLGSNQIQDAFGGSLRQHHFMLVDQDPLPPLLVLGRLSREQGYEIVLGGTTIEGRRCRRRLGHHSNPKASAKGLDRDAKQVP